jgi:two-component system, chemotaxis family, chemotaxis protein CheY
MSAQKVLIVDDSPTIRRMVIASLRELPNINFEEAGSGLEAIERLAIGPVAVVILDLNMPDMHGGEVLKFLRSNPTFGKVPVIVLTTRNDDASRKGAISAGASLYLTKPFEPKNLLQQVKQFLDIP